NYQLGRLVKPAPVVARMERSDCVCMESKRNAQGGPQGERQGRCESIRGAAPRIAPLRGCIRATRLWPGWSAAQSGFSTPRVAEQPQQLHVPRRALRYAALDQVEIQHQVQRRDTHHDDADHDAEGAAAEEEGGIDAGE